MTERDAIKEIETSLELAEMCEPNREREKEIKAYKMAINALEEIQQHRALGMTSKQVKEMQIDYCVKSTILEEYKALGTVEELRVARDKQIPKKPVLVARGNGIIKFYPCPNTDCSNPNKYMQVYPNQKYCVYCGQKLDWSDEDERCFR